MCNDDLNPETLYKLALLILFGADFTAIIIVFGTVRNLFCIGQLLHELVG